MIHESINCSTSGCPYIACEFFRLSNKRNEIVLLSAACSKCAENLRRVYPAKDNIEVIDASTFTIEEVMLEYEKTSYCLFMNLKKLRDLIE